VECSLTSKEMIGELSEITSSGSPAAGLRPKDVTIPQQSISSDICCRFCGRRLEQTFVDLGTTPLCESYLRPEDLNGMEPFYPLHAMVCSSCYLVQVPAVVSAREIFTEYAYFSSYSDSWVDHARRYTEAMISRFGLNKNSYVIEIASNDGYLLRWFVNKGLRVLGIEPAVNVASEANKIGVPTLTRFFDEETAMELASSGTKADLLIGNNVLAQVPDLNGFVRAMQLLLRPDGIITMEFPHLMKLVDDCQFDTIYHEHFSYFSLLTVEQIFDSHGLLIFDVEELETHGGSLRIYAGHAGHASKVVTGKVKELRAREESCGMSSLGYYSAFGEKVKEVKRKLLECLIAIKASNKQIAAYGAPGKGNTLLNYCGVRGDFIDYAVDRNPYKQGRFTPGTRIPIFSPERIRETKPEYVLILPWNLKHEIVAQMSYIREWGGKFVVPIPEATVL